MELRVEEEEEQEEEGDMPGDNAWRLGRRKGTGDSRIGRGKNRRGGVCGGRERRIERRRGRSRELPPCGRETERRTKREIVVITKGGDLRERKRRRRKV